MGSDGAVRAGSETGSVTVPAMCHGRSCPRFDELTAP
jgi:hypothetical protein